MIKLVNDPLCLCSSIPGSWEKIQSKNSVVTKLVRMSSIRELAFFCENDEGVYFGVIHEAASNSFVLLRHRQDDAPVYESVRKGIDGIEEVIDKIDELYCSGTWVCTKGQFPVLRRDSHKDQLYKEALNVLFNRTCPGITGFQSDESAEYYLRHIIMSNPEFSGMISMIERLFDASMDDIKKAFVDRYARDNSQ